MASLIQAYILHRGVMMVILVVLALALSPRYAVTYVPGGETVKQVVARTHAKEVLGGDYYAKCDGWHVPFDLVIVNGRKVVAYQGKKPVLAISRSGMMRIEKPYRRRKDDLYAVTGSTYPVKPGLRTARQVVVLLSPRRLKLVKFVGTYGQAKRRLRGRYLFMDGGHSVNPWVRMPTHIVRRW